MTDAQTFNADFFTPHLKALQDLDVFVKMCYDGLSTLTQSSAEGRAAIDGDDDIDELGTPAMLGHLLRNQHTHTFLAEQAPHEFPYLFSLAVVQLWTVMESMVDDLVLYFVKNSPSARQLRPLRDLKGPLLDFADASREEQAEFLMELLQQHVKAKLQPGVGRFENVLAAVGIGGGIHETAQRVLLELSQVRNVIVHRNGRVDNKFVERCPWLKLNRGDTVVIDSTRFSLYVFACNWYMIELARRWLALDPKPNAENTATRALHEETLASIERVIDALIHAIDSGDHGPLHEACLRMNELIAAKWPEGTL